MQQDAGSAHQTTPRDRAVRRVILIEGLVNVVILLTKIGVGIATGSLAVLADAMHSLTDVTNNIMAWFVIRASAQPPDREHPYGHRKFETLAVFALATLLTVVAIELLLHALRREPTVVSTTPLALWLMVGVLVVNILIAVWERGWAKKLDAEILHADASHTFADVLTTLVVIAGWQLSAHGYVWLDTLCALGVAGLVLYLAWQLFRRAVPVLVDETSIDPDQLAQRVGAVDGVQDVLRARSRWQGGDRVVDLVVTVDPKLNTVDAHAIADAIEDELRERFAVADVSIHVEPDESDK